MSGAKSVPPSGEVRSELTDRIDAARRRFGLQRFVSEQIDGADVRGKDETPRGVDELVARMRDYVNDRLPEREPEEDLMQMSDIVGEERDVLIVHPFGDDDQKHWIFGEMLPAVVQASHARALVTMQHGWAARDTEDEDGVHPGDDAWVMPRDRPDKIEVVSMYACDGLRFVQLMGRVERTENEAPKIAEWFDCVEVPADEAGGDIVRPVVTALRICRLGRAFRLWLAEQPADWWTATRREAFSVMDESVALSMKDGEFNTGKAAMKAFDTLYVDESTGKLRDGLRELADQPDLWDRAVPRYSSEPWSA